MMAERRRPGPLAQAILEALKRQGRKPYWLGQQIGVSPSNIYSMLGRDFRVSQAEKMMKVLGLRIVQPGRDRVRELEADREHS